ncbi:MAG: histidine triad nucleotide-binding protein, partial [Proteobacteria bacterium]|nr:histidine triad nucleotide-binding protein [Pseudomonadota bacterium]
MSNNCLFCKIVRREIPSEFLYEDDNFIVFKDI